MGYLYGVEAEDLFGVPVTRHRSRVRVVAFPGDDGVDLLLLLLKYLDKFLSREIRPAISTVALDSRLCTEIRCVQVGSLLPMYC